MIDLYIKRIVIHQFIPGGTELILSGQLLTITPRIDEYFRKKLSRVFSDEAKRGIFAEDDVFLSYLSGDLIESSVKIVQPWKEEFVVLRNRKTDDLVFIQLDKDGTEHFASLHIASKENFTHISSNGGSPVKVIQNDLSSAAQTSDEALVINRSNHHYYLIEKRIKHSGSPANYFSENPLQVQPEQSAKKSIKVVEQIAQKTAENFQQDDSAFQSKMKAAIHKNLEEEQELSPEGLADQPFDSNLTARLTFVGELRESIPESIQVADIDHSRRAEKLENQRLSLSNGIQLIIPNSVYDDTEPVELIQNLSGTYSILIKNIEDIQNK